MLVTLTKYQKKLKSVRHRIVSNLDTTFGATSKLGHEKILDVVLDQDESIGALHCKIRYCPFKQKFLIKDLGEGGGTFVSIESPTIL